MQTVNRVVLERISVCFHSTFSEGYDTDIIEQVNNIFKTPKGQWVRSIGAKVVTHRCIKNSELVSEIIVYTELTDIQITEFVLRFL